MAHHKPGNYDSTVPAKKTIVTPPALTDADVSELRARVAAGEKPRVVVRTASASVAAGTRGNVVRLGDPKDGEYIVVRLGRDEVPFAPVELGIAGRPAAPSAAAAVRAPAKATTAPQPKRVAASRTSRTAARKRVPPLVVTLRFRDGDWTVEALRGARRLAKPAPIRPGAVSAFAEHLDDESLRETLVETVDSARSLIEAQRAELRARLEATEAELRDYDARPRKRDPR
jgi:hypothetical protein